ncbi:MAG: hypothetical protein H6744_19345 [Deltaproteobacteria bacterium]|nr:hypothetical protein [Deltaproteobacteria bacterium]MCB9788836.1 hypothetical protein [Deltaproteobacteria bacterium]
MRHLIIRIGLAMWAPWLACCGAPSPDAPSEPAAAPTEVLARDLDGALSVTLPADLVVHLQRQAIQATAPDGSLRIFVGREADEPLIKLAGPAKDALVALGWQPEGEQHFEFAILTAFRRGGTRDAPAERRQIWWVRRGGVTYVCDAIAQGHSDRRLGDAFRALCQGVEVSGGAAVADPSPDGGAGPAVRP